MKVRLLETILEGRSVKTTLKEGREPIVWVKGAVFEMSDATAAKFIERKQAEPFVEEAKP